MVLRTSQGAVATRRAVNGRLTLTQAVEGGRVPVLRLLLLKRLDA